MIRAFCFSVAIVALFAESTKARPNGGYDPLGAFQLGEGFSAVFGSSPEPQHCTPTDYATVEGYHQELEAEVVRAGGEKQNEVLSKFWNDPGTGSSEPAGSSDSSPSDGGSNVASGSRDRSRPPLYGDSDGSVLDALGKTLDLPDFGNWNNVWEASERGYGDSVYREVAQYPSVNRDRFASDQAIIRQEYRASTPAQLNEQLVRSERNLTEVSKALEKKNTELIEAARSDLAKMVSDASDRAREAREKLQDGNLETRDQIDQIMPKVRSLGEYASLNRAMIDELALLYGIEKRKREKLESRLDSFELALQNRKVELPDDGSLLAVAAQPKPIRSCTDFMGRVLHPVSTDRYLTREELKEVWNFLASGSGTEIENVDSEKRKWLRWLSRGFEAINVYRGAEVQSGDLMIFGRESNVKPGPYVVKEYNHTIGLVKLLGSGAPSLSMVSEEIRLVKSVSPTQKDYLPGIYVLRLRTKRNPVCTFEKGSRLARR